MSTLDIADQQIYLIDKMAIFVTDEVKGNEVKCIETYLLEKQVV